MSYARFQGHEAATVQWLGTLVINGPIVGVYMPIMRIPGFPIKGGMRSSPKKGSVDPGTNMNASPFNI